MAVPESFRVFPRKVPGNSGELFEEILPNQGDRILSSTGAARSSILPMRVPNCSPVLDRSLAPTGPRIFSSTGAGV